MAKPNCIELPTGEKIPILYEDRAVMAIDKPRGWMLVPFSWQRTDRNLQAALTSSLAAKDFWAKSRNLKFIRFVHRLDAETTGILLLAKSLGAVDTYGNLFESRRMEKVYLAVVHGVPKQTEWTARFKLSPDAERHGRMKVDPRGGKEAETTFRVLQAGTKTSLIEAHPFTGRTHQIRVHLLESGFPIVGDDLYGPEPKPRKPLALRAVSLAFNDPFNRKRIHIRASADWFLREYGFQLPKAEIDAAVPAQTEERSAKAPEKSKRS